MSAEVPTPPAPKPSLWWRVYKSWATRSLAIGALATVFDLALGGTLVHFEVPTRAAAMAGTILGGGITFLANRYFAFREKNPKLTSPLVRFILATMLASVVHGQLMVFFVDGRGYSYVPSKMISDICVFTFGQLLVLRYVVFGKPKPPTSPSAEPAPTPAGEPEPR